MKTRLKPYPTPPSGCELTADLAVERALYWDRFVAWEKPWTQTTCKNELERCTVELFYSEELGIAAKPEGSQRKFIPGVLLLAMDAVSEPIGEFCVW